MFDIFRALNTFASSNRIILTDKPLNNNLAELWFILNFILPEVFNSLTLFESWFNIKEMMEDETDEKILKEERESQVISKLHEVSNDIST